MPVVRRLHYDTQRRQTGWLDDQGEFHRVTITAASVSGVVLLSSLQPASAGSLLLGRRASGGGSWEEITLGTGLTMTTNVLSATGGGSGLSHAGVKRRMLALGG